MAIAPPRGFPQNVTIYAIEHIESGNAYVGSTMQKSWNRWTNHRWHLVDLTHHAPKLQNAKCME